MAATSSNLTIAMFQRPANKYRWPLLKNDVADNWSRGPSRDYRQHNLCKKEEHLPQQPVPQRRNNNSNNLEQHQHKHRALHRR